MSGISTHVLDTARGVPAIDLPVKLEWQDSAGHWQLLATTATDQDGRCPQLSPAGSNLQAGHYRLIFDTERYFASQKIHGLYPSVQITFAVRAGEAHFHIPLLLSAYGYTTYRGS
jgi:5-hydroxyisourate hydrolase